MSSAFFLVAFAQVAGSAPNEPAPLLTAKEVLAAAQGCSAKVEVTEIPPGIEGAGSENDPVQLLVGVDRSSSAESRKCFAHAVPSVMISVIGRDPKLPPLKRLGQSDLDALLSRCRWQRSDGVVRLAQDNALILQPNVRAKFDHLDCVLAGVKDTYDVKLGFIGNEAYQENESGKK